MKKTELLDERYDHDLEGGRMIFLERLRRGREVRSDTYE